MYCRSGLERRRAELAFSEGRPMDSPNDHRSIEFHYYHVSFLVDIV